MPTQEFATGAANLLQTPIHQLGLKIAGSRLEPILAEFQQELARVGLRRLRPHFYLSTEWGVPFDTLAVAMSYDPPAYVVNYAETRKLPFGVAIDNTGAIAKSFGQVQLTPTSVLINKRGEIVKRYVGEPDFAALHQLVEKLLAENA